MPCWHQTENNFKLFDNKFYISVKNQAEKYKNFFVSLSIDLGVPVRTCVSKYLVNRGKMMNNCILLCALIFYITTKFAEMLITIRLQTDYFYHKVVILGNVHCGDLNFAQQKRLALRKSLDNVTWSAPASSFMWISRNDSKVAWPQKQTKLSRNGRKIVGFWWTDQKKNFFRKTKVTYWEQFQ